MQVQHASLNACPYSYPNKTSGCGHTQEQLFLKQFDSYTILNLHAAIWPLKEKRHFGLSYYNMDNNNLTMKNKKSKNNGERAILHK